MAPCVFSGPHPRLGSSPEEVTPSWIPQISRIPIPPALLPDPDLIW